MIDEDNRNIHMCMVIGTFVIFCVVVVIMLPFSSNFLSSSMVDPTNLKNNDFYNFPLFSMLSQKTFAQNESYLKYRFDGLVNYDQISWNRGIDFKKCYSRDSRELDDAIASDTHYVKIRGNTPDEALGTISLPSITLNAGYSIPNPKQLYVSKFKQISPNEYKLWIITKEPTVETIDGALENTCKVSYFY